MGTIKQQFRAASRRLSKLLSAIAAVISIAAPLAVVACSDGGSAPTEPEPQPPAISTTSLSAGTVGEAYAAQLSATGGNGTYVWSLTAGTLPTGLTLYGDGSLTGTPTTAGDATFTVQVLSDGQTASAQLSLTIANPAVRITTASLPSGTVGEAYTAQLSASGGDGSYAWSVSAGTLPESLSLTAEGAISGTPTAAGTVSFTIQATSDGSQASAQLSIEVKNPPVAISTTSLPAGTVGVDYSAQLEASDGDGTYAWSLTEGELPAGLSLSPEGAITGTPTTAGTSAFTVQVESDETNASAELTIEIADPELSITTEELPAAVAEIDYSAQLAATGGDGTYAWSVIDGALPNGLTLASDGTISGTPTTPGIAAFTVEVASEAQRDSARLSIEVGNPPVSIVTEALPPGAVGEGYAVQLEARGGDERYTWSLLSGELPAGLSLTVAGRIQGTPTATGVSVFEVEVASDGTSDTAELSIEIVLPALGIVTSSLPAGTVNVAYSSQLSATGGDGTYEWSLTSGLLPDGLSLSADGVISGTPTAAGSSTFSVTVTSAGQTAGLELSLEIANPTLAITTDSLPAGTINVAYSSQLSATGGDGTYAWSVTSGSLPGGLSLSADGVISGTPTAAGASTLGITVSSAGVSASRDFNLIVRYPLVQLGEQVTPLSSSGGSLRFNLEVPAGTDQLAILTGAGSGAVDLYVDDGLTAEPSTSTCDQYIFSTTNQFCVINRPTAGTWAITLSGSYSNVTLSVNPTPTTVTPGASTTVSATNQSALYSLEVPVGTPQLAVTTGSGSGAVDLFVGPGSYTSGDVAVCDQYIFTTTNQLCVINDPTPGSWAITLSGSFSNVALNVNPAPTSIALGASTNVSATDQSLLYQVDIPAGTAQLAVTTGNGSGALDLYVGPGSYTSGDVAVCDEYIFTTTNQLCVINNPIAGPWSIAMMGSFSNVTLDVNPAPTSIALGASATANASDASVFYEIAVSAGTAQLAVATGGGSGAVDLYVGPGSYTSKDVAVCDEYIVTTTNQLCVINNPSAGTWAVALMGSFSNVTVDVNPTPTPVALGASTTVSSSDQSVFYELSVPSGTSRMTITTSAGTGDVDLFVGPGPYASQGESACADYIATGTSKTCVIDNPTPGTWAITLKGSFSGVTLSTAAGGG